ncbi:DUF262 domain-containing protein [Pectobacterium polaris]|uniref:DUF262 domain-containing protein n=1 Tax=Pectobacterium polaris TaxID=2042057 RepID=UPI0023AF8A63|nr:DUF262 domain-containing protein [Pectobacterium polaris]MDE8740378.1 DUF262 domain-containing protein [Pectobacterium polaris]
MEFNDLVYNLEKLIELPLQSLSGNEKLIFVKRIDRDSKKYFLNIDGQNRISTRSFKDLENVIQELNRTGFCNIEQFLKTSKLIQTQTQTVLANLPFISHFKFENLIYLVLRNEYNRPFGTLHELSNLEQRSVRKVITNIKNLHYSQFSHKLTSNISLLHKEIENIHILSPGLLADTGMRELLAEFDSLSNILDATTLQLDRKNKTDPNLESLAEVIESNDFDMADLVDMSYITGIDEGNNNESSLVDDENEESDDPLNLINIPGIRRQTPSFALLYERLLYDEIEIQPDYQRKDRIWSDDKKSKLIESILMGLPLPIFYFGERKNDNWVVIDGLQRLTTIQDFMQNKFPLKLDASSSVLDANNQYFKDFNRNNTRAIREFEITAYVIDIEDPKSSKFITELFHRINTYGVKLSDQEIRSAIYFGPSVFYLKFLASSKIFTLATSNTVNPKRQKDLELCLGALSFIINGYKNFRNNRFDDFLTSTMQRINKQTTKKISKDNVISFISESPMLTLLTKNFEQSLKFCHEIFGKDSFKKVRKSSKRDPISKPLFEVFISVFANASEEQKIKIRENKELFINTIYKAINDDSDDYSTWLSQSYIDAKRGLHYAISNSTGKRVTILYRFDSIINIIKQTTGCDINIIPLMELDNDYTINS